MGSHIVGVYKDMYIQIVKHVKSLSDSMLDDYNYLRNELEDKSDPYISIPIFNNITVGI